MSKYFTVEIEPTIAGNLLDSAFANGQILFDWQPIQVPRGANKLVAATAVLRSKDGDHQTGPKFDLFFAKSINGTAPSTLGVVNNAVTGLPVIANHLIGMTHFEAGEFGGNAGESFTVGSTGSGSSSSNIPNIILEAELNSGDNVGYDTLYVGATCGNAIDFGTTVLARGGEAEGATTVETDKGANDDPDAELIFAPGDIIHGHTGAVVGTIASIGSFIAYDDTDGTSIEATGKQVITFTAALPEALDDNEELLCVNPIRVILSFEK